MVLQMVRVSRHHHTPEAEVEEERLHSLVKGRFSQRSSSSSSSSLVFSVEQIRVEKETAPSESLNQDYSLFQVFI